MISKQSYLLNEKGDALGHRHETWVNDYPIFRSIFAAIRPLGTWGLVRSLTTFCHVQGIRLLLSEARDSGPQQFGWIGRSQSTCVMLSSNLSGEVHIT
jgi:hypothetical protein